MLKRFLETVRAAFSPAPMREAAGFTLSDDDTGWTPLSGHGDRNLPPYDHARMQETAQWLWQSNMLANRMIELPAAFVLGEGVRLACRDEDAQRVLDKFWRDPVNHMDLFIRQIVRELAVFGDICLPVFVNEYDGSVRLGYIEPTAIATVVRDPDNPRLVAGIITKTDKKGRQFKYRVIYNEADTAIFTERTQAMRAEFQDGECFFFRINDLVGQARGRSDLTASADWLDSYENYLFGEADRANFLRAFIWDVTLTGASPDDVARRAREISTPKPGSVRVHNEGENWKAEAPDLKIYEANAGARLFRNHILSGHSLPEHWYGGGGDVNRATAAEMGDPAFKVLGERQNIFRHILEEIGAYVLRQHYLHSGGIPQEMPAVQAVFPEMIPKDTSRYAQSLQQTVVSAGLMLDRGLITDKTALAIIKTIVDQIGVAIDVDAELDAARQDALQKKEQDIYREPPAPPGVM